MQMVMPSISIRARKTAPRTNKRPVPKDFSTANKISRILLAYTDFFVPQQVLNSQVCLDADLVEPLRLTETQSLPGKAANCRLAGSGGQ